jgi:hypothetical protein
MKRYVLYGLLGFLALILLFLFFSSLPLEHRTVYAQVEVGEGIGIDVNDTALMFGRLDVRRGSSLLRSVVYNNTYDFPVILLLSAQGDVAPFLSFEEKLLVDTGEGVEIQLQAYAAPSVAEGVYTGSFTLTVYKGRKIFKQL